MQPAIRQDIQGLRGFAIVLVVLLHAGVAGFQGGFVGVELFFVLSGYVVTESALRHEPLALKANLTSFYQKRVLHLVPLATVVIVATLFAAFFLLGPAFNTDLIEDARWSSLFAANWRFISVGANYFIQGLDQSLLNHYWYLAIEQQVYLFYPLIVFVAIKFTPAERRRIVLGGFAVLAMAISGWWSFAQTTTDATVSYYSPWTRVWEIALGCLIALIPGAVAQKTPKWVAVLAGVLGLAAILSAALVIDSTMPYPGVLAWWPALGTAALLWANERQVRFGPTSWLSNRVVRWLGDRSYALYLWHYIWLMLPVQMVTPPGPEWLPAQLAGALACAALSHRFIEKPIMNSERLKRDGLATILLLLISIALVWNASLIVEQLAIRATL
ncbi:MAG: acyltransferase [Actinomycetota bacterium]